MKIKVIKARPHNVYAINIKEGVDQITTNGPEMLLELIGEN